MWHGHGGLRVPGDLGIVQAMMLSDRWDGMEGVGLGWVELDCVGKGWDGWDRMGGMGWMGSIGSGRVGLGSVGLGWVGLGWDGMAWYCEWDGMG